MIRALQTNDGMQVMSFVRYRALAVCGAVAALSGCASDTGDGSFVSRLRAPDATKVTHAEEVNAGSEIIQGLMARRSALPQGSSFERVASAVLAANARAAEADLRAARLRSEAASKNWLPKIGPQITLSSMGSLVANLVVEQVLFDNGRLEGEREFAIADVEVAAVGLAQDTNERVHTGLGLYLTAAEAREKAALSNASLRDMSEFEFVMSERVKGGVSDRSDLSVLRQKLAEIRAERAANQETAATAQAELNAMSAEYVADVRGVTPLKIGTGAAEPLGVVLAKAESERAVAAAKVDRAGQLPGLTAGGTVGEGSDFGLTIKSDTLLGLGTGARLQAIEATRDAAARRVAQASEDSNRELRRLEGQIVSKSRQAAEAARLTAQARDNLDLFQEQYRAGQREVIDVVSVYETFARQQEAEITLKFEAASLQVDLARHLGLLADGEQI